MIHLRQDRDRFGPAEGILPSREAHYYLLGRFPQHHIFAATDLERYAACPFRFFLERVLEIEPAGRPDAGVRRPQSRPRGP